MASSGSTNSQPKNQTQKSAGKQGEQRMLREGSRRRHSQWRIHSQSILCPARETFAKCFRRTGSLFRVNKISDFDIQFQARCHRPKEANDQMVKETTSPQRHGPPVTRPKRMEMQARKSAVALPLFRFLHHVHCAKLAMWSHPHPPSQLILNDLISCAPFVLPLVFRVFLTKTTN